MSERDSYPPGVPCWVDTVQDDPHAAGAFYELPVRLELVGSGDEELEYFVARLRGRDVAGIASRPPDGHAPAWFTHVRVASADAAAEQATASGGAVIDGPIDASPAGRFAVLADPTGARFCAWEAETREGAELVNEPGAWAMSALQTSDPGARGRVLPRAVRMGGRAVRADPSAAPARLRRRHARATRPARRRRRDGAARRRRGCALGRRLLGPGRGGRGRAAIELGGRVLVAVHDRPPFRSAVLADPEGAAFSISQLVMGRRTAAG